MEVVETGDVFRAAYLLSRGGQVQGVFVEGGSHVVLTVGGEHLLQEDRRYRAAQGHVEPLCFKENLNRLRDLVKQTLRERDHTDGRKHYGTDTARRT